ncbi:MAG: hypothetical protein QGF00_17650 [Planctomycetota bacterium]|nr:hypothetical protein [Planctomycetota bacterium]
MKLHTSAYKWFDEAIEDVRHDLQRNRVTSGICMAAAICLAITIGLFVLDNLLHLSVAYRSLLTPMWILTMTALVAILVVRRIARPVSRTGAALSLKEEFPDLGERPVNAVQITDGGEVNSFVAALVEEAKFHMKKVDLAKTGALKKLAKPAALAAIMFAGLIIYASAFPAWFMNAADRYLHPTQEIAQVGAPDIDVSPGNAALTIGESLSILALVHGEFEGQPEILWRTGSAEWQTVEMSTAAEAFGHQFANVRTPFVYRVRAGKGISQSHRVTVHPSIGISGIRLRYEYPPYTKVFPKDVPESDGHVEAVAGTKVSLTLKSSRPVTSAELVMADLERTPLAVEDGAMRGSMVLKESGNYSIEMVPASGIAGPPVSYRVVSVPDGPPNAELATELSSPTASPTDTVPLKIVASDDFGLGKVVLQINLTGEEADWKPVNEWNFEGQESVSLKFPLELADWSPKPDTTLALRIQAADLNDLTGPGLTLSDEVILQIKDDKGISDEKEEQFATGLEALEKLVQRQNDNLEQTEDIRDRLKPDGNFSGSDKARFDIVLNNQTDIQKKTIEVANLLGATHPAAPLTLKPLAANEMVEAVQMLETAGATETGDRIQQMSDATKIEQRVLWRLEELLERLAYEQHAVRVHEVLQAFQRIRETQDEIKARTAVEGESLKMLAREESHLHPKTTAAIGLLKTLSGNLRSISPELAKAALAIYRGTNELRIPADIVQAQTFLQEKRREKAVTTEQEILEKVEATIASLVKALAENADKEKEELKDALKKSAMKAEKLSELEKKAEEAIEALNQENEDKLDETDQKKYEQLAEFHKRAANVSECAADDLKKMPQNSLTDAMAKEWESMTGQLDDLEKALEKKEPKEVCVECTEKLLAKLSKIKEKSEDGLGMLDQSPDTKSFNLEDAPEGAQKGMELPELPDKLMDMVGDLIDGQEDENEDTDDKSSNLAQADSKAGVAKEGPISSFGGKGKTGNHQPDPTEVSGRGGAGRTGQTSGELVEGETKNLDGKATPERRTPDAVQESTESIKDNDPKHGTATGGGKKGGAGGEGMAGKNNDVFEEDLEELAERQDSLRTSAQQLESTLRSMHLPTWTLPDAVRLMNSAEENLRGYNLTEAREKQKQALKALKLSYLSMKGKSYIQSEKSSALPEKLKRQVIEARREKLPAGYQELVEKYYQEISERAGE